VAAVKQQIPRWRHIEPWLNVVLLLGLVAALVLLLHCCPYGDRARGFYGLLVVGTPIACFVAFRMTTVRLLALLVIAGGLGYLKESLAVHGGVWYYPFSGESPPLPGGAPPQPYVALITAFSGVGIYALAHVADEVLGVRARLRTRRWYIGPVVVIGVLALLLVLLRYEAHGPYASAALVAIYFATRARLGRILVTMGAAMGACLVGEHIGIRDELWSFKEERTPLFLILGAWPLEFFAYYSLAAATDALLSRPGRDDFDRAVEGELDRMVRWTVSRPQSTLSLLYFLVLPCMAFEELLFAGKGLRSQWVFLLPLAALYGWGLVVVRAMGQRRFRWLVACGAVLGLVAEACHFWQYGTPEPHRFLFMIPTWALIAVAAYGLAAHLARWMCRVRDWSWGDPNFAAAAIAIALVAVSCSLAEQPAGDNWLDGWPGIVVLVLYSAGTAVVAYSAGLAAALPMVLLGLGYVLLPAHPDADLTPMRVLTALPFVWLTAHLVRAGASDLELRPLLALIVASVAVLALVHHVAGNVGVISHIGTSFPWFFVVGLGPLVIGGCYALSASAAGERLTKEPSPKPVWAQGQFEAPSHGLPPKSVVVVVQATAKDGESQAERATSCLRESIQLLAKELGHDDDERPIRHFAGSGKQVFIKPNVVLPMYSPSTVLPELVRELARLSIEEADASCVRIGETSLSDFTARQSLIATGLKEYWEDAGPDKRVEVLALDESKWLRMPAGQQQPVYFRSLPLWLSKSKCDCYISISKMKTHYITGVTLAIKNSLGLIPDEEKRLEHRGIHGVKDLARKLVAITQARPPDLVIIDGFDGLEGNGPFVGQRVDTEMIIASNDPVAADAVAATIMGFDPETIDTCTEGTAKQLGRYDLSAITIVTQGVPDGKLPRRPFRRAQTWPQAGAKADGEFMEDEWVGPIRLIADDPTHDAHAGPESTLYGLISFIEPLAEVYLKTEYQKLRGLSIVYGSLTKPLECETALLFGDGAIASDPWVYAPEIWRIPGEIPNVFLEGFEQVVERADADVAALLATTLRASRGDYL
jgi:uncharacterized protein (DUF362 family)